MSSPQTPKTMHGVQLVKYGTPAESLVYSEQVPVPKLTSDTQVLIRIKATGINPIEAKIASGNMKFLKVLISLPCVLGADYSGIVAAKGSKVTEFEIGDEVFGSQTHPIGGKGTYAQYTVIDINDASIAKKPANLSFEQAASAGIAVLTAYQGVVLNGRITEATKNIKRNILIIGASGGVGSYSIQVAKSINPENTVIGICSEKNVDYVKSLGADRVINYRDKEEYEEFLREDIQFDVVFDCVGGDAYYSKLDKKLKKKGVYSSAVGPVEHAGSESIGVTTAISFVSNLVYKKLFAPHPYVTVSGLPHKEFRSKIAPLFNDKLEGTVSPENIYPLRDIVKAYEAIWSHRTVGKIVLTVE